MSNKTSDLCDACDQAQVCRLAFRNFGRRRAFSGSIRTIRYVEGISALRDLVREPGDDQVLVIDAGNAPWLAVFGDKMGTLAAENRWAGIVVNGWIRDSSEIDEMDVGIKALGTTPSRASIIKPGEVDLPVSFGGVTFAPGSWVVADEDGVVVLPPGVSERDVDLTGALAATAMYAGAATIARSK